MDIGSDLFGNIDFEKKLFSLYNEEFIFKGSIKIDFINEKTKEIIITIYLEKGKIVNLKVDDKLVNGNLLINELPISLINVLHVLEENIKDYFLEFLVTKIEDEVNLIKNKQYLLDSDKSLKKLEYLNKLYIILNNYIYFIKLSKFKSSLKSSLDINSAIIYSEIDLVGIIKSEYVEEVIYEMIKCYIDNTSTYNEEQVKILYNSLESLDLKCYFINNFLKQIIQNNKNLSLLDNIVEDFKDVVKYSELNILLTLTNNCINLNNSVVIGDIYKKLSDTELIFCEKIFKTKDLFIYMFFSKRLLLGYSISNIFKILKYTDTNNINDFLDIIDNIKLIDKNITKNFIEELFNELSIRCINNLSKYDKNFIKCICDYCCINGIYFNFGIQDYNIKAKDFFIYNIIYNIYREQNFSINIFNILDDIIINNEELENIILNTILIYNDYKVLDRFIIYFLENNSKQSKNFIKSFYDKTDNMFVKFYTKKQIKMSHYLINKILKFAVKNLEKDVSNLLECFIGIENDFTNIIDLNKNNDDFCFGVTINKSNNTTYKSGIFCNLMRLYKSKENINFVKNVIKKISDIELLEKCKNFTEKGKCFYNIINYKIEELKELEKLKNITFVNKNIDSISFGKLYDNNPNGYIKNFFNIIDTQNVEEDDYNDFYDIIVNLENSIENKDIFLEKFKHNENFCIFYINKKLENENIFLKKENNNFFIVKKDSGVRIKIEKGNQNVVDYIIYNNNSNHVELEFLKLIEEKTGIKKARIKNYEKHVIFGF